MSFESFLKARSKNMAEEVRLQKILSTLDLEKRQWKKEVFNEMFEEQRIAYALKRSSKEIKQKAAKKRAAKRGKIVTSAKAPTAKKTVKLPDISFLTRSLVGGDDDKDAQSTSKQDTEGESAEGAHDEEEPPQKTAFGSPRSMPPMKMSGGFSNISVDPPKKKAAKPPQDTESLPDIGVTNKVIPKITVNSGDSNGKKETTSEAGIGLTEPVGKMKFASVVETFLNKRNTGDDVEETGSKATDGVGQVNQEVSSDEGVVNSDRFNRKPCVISPVPRKVNLKELVGRLFPTILRKARSLGQLEKLKEGEEDVKKNRQKKPCEEDNSSRDGSEDEPPEPLDPVIIVKDYWVGDPKAIGSVRRPRQAPEVMASRHKNVGEVMKLIRDLPMYPSCSRNCNRPGAVFDSMALSSPQMMMPSLAKASVARRNRRLSSIKTPPGMAGLAVAAVAASNTFPLPPIPQGNGNGDHGEPSSEDIQGSSTNDISVNNAVTSTGNTNAVVGSSAVDVNAPSEQRRIERKFQQQKKSLRKTTRELRKNLKKATERQTLKPTQKVVVDGRAGTRLQIAYTFNPLSRLHERQGNALAEKVK